MKVFWQSVFILAVAVFACFHARAADIGVASQFTGMVVDEQGQAVAGATVDCYQYKNPPIMMGSIFREPEFKQRFITDSKGVFAVAASPDITLVVVKKTGLAPAWKTWPAGRADSSDPLVLTAPTTLSGVVVDENDQPVLDAEVMVSSVTVGDLNNGATGQNDLFGRLARESFSARTALDGRFRFENFPADGHASLAVSKPGLSQRPTDGTFIGAVDYQSGQREIRLKLGPAGSIEGKVSVQETSKPVAGAEIRLLASTGAGGTHGPVLSGADGTFRITGLEPAAYNVWATMPGKPVPEWAVVPEYGLVTVAAGETVRDVQIHATAGVMVEVTVVSTNDLQPLANVAVSTGRLTAYTESNGLALLRMTPGKSWFSASKQDWSRQQITAEIEDGRTNQVQLELVPPPRIAGIVRDSSGAPAPGVLVSFHPGMYPNARDYAEVKPIKTDAMRRF